MYSCGKKNYTKTNNSTDYINKQILYKLDTYAQQRKEEACLSPGRLSESELLIKLGSEKKQKLEKSILT